MYGTHRYVTFFLRSRVRQVSGEKGEVYRFASNNVHG